MTSPSYVVLHQVRTIEQAERLQPARRVEWRLHGSSSHAADSAADDEHVYASGESSSSSHHEGGEKGGGGGFDSSFKRYRRALKTSADGLGGVRGGFGTNISQVC